MSDTRKWYKVKEFDGLPKRKDFNIVEEKLPILNDGEVLVEAQWISVDPYMRTAGMGTKPGSVMGGEQVAKVIESKSKNFSVGDLVQGMLGWVTRSIVSDMTTIRKVHQSAIDVSPSTALGILGMTGATAYLGLNEIGKPKAGETLLVTGAAGAVGSAVGQIGKILGMRVVEFTGSDEKVAYLKSLGFDAAFNYKTVSSIAAAIQEGCPNGVDVFFDNVGGEFFDATLTQMNLFGRAAICGAIAEYNAKEPRKALSVSPLILTKQLTVQGFVCYRWFDRWPEAFQQLSQWIKEGKLKYEEGVYDGFDKLCDAFVSLFHGTNTGKVVVKA